MDTSATELHYLELTELAARIRAREVSPMTVTRAQLDRIAALDGVLGSYALVMSDVAMAQAEAAEAEIAAGRYRGLLHGRADRGERSVLDQGFSYRGWHGDLQGLPPGRGCDRGASPEGSRRGAAGQTATHGRRLLRSPPVRDAAEEWICAAASPRCSARSTCC